MKLQLEQADVKSKELQIKLRIFKFKFGLSFIYPKGLTNLEVMFIFTSCG